MLLANQADRHDPTGRYGERWPEEFLQVEYPGGMVAERAVPKIGRNELGGLVEPLVE
jgi:hypothetical protein